MESDGTISLERGTTTTVSSAGVMEGQSITLGSSGGTTITTVTGVNSLLKSRGTLTAGPRGNEQPGDFGGGQSRVAGGDDHRRTRRRQRQRGRVRSGIEARRWVRR